MTGLVWGYIDRFNGVTFESTYYLKALRCRLKSPKTARVLTLVNGTALNFDAGGTAPKQFPVEQQLEILLHSANVGLTEGLAATLQVIMAEQGKQGTLRVRVPGGGTYSCTAILDWAEITEDGYMGSDLKNWSLLVLYFQQLTEWA